MDDGAFPPSTPPVSQVLSEASETCHGSTSRTRKRSPEGESSDASRSKTKKTKRTKQKAQHNVTLEQIKGLLDNFQEEMKLQRSQDLSGMQKQISTLAGKLEVSLSPSLQG